ncbi:MAG: retropepsin-like aspartic protease [bacterium]
MRIFKILLVLCLGTLVLWGAEFCLQASRNAAFPAEITARAERERGAMQLEFATREKNLEQEFAGKKHLATGKTIYDRIYNSPNQSIEDMIRHISREALPENWSCDVKVDEFTHFVLLIYQPTTAVPVEAAAVVPILLPILKYCGGYLSDVAVFDKTRKSSLFFDKDVLAEIRQRENISAISAERAKKQGVQFTRYNSITVPCQESQGHFFVKIEIGGRDGVVPCVALLDTGASVTMISTEAAEKSDGASLASAPQRTFDTANGRLLCPVVRRDVLVQGYRRNIEVAVNRSGTWNLLGVNFFEGLDYVVDSQNSCIHFWEKNPAAAK